MKDHNSSSLNKVKNYIRTFNIIDEDVLDSMCDTDRSLFTPDYYKPFAYSDIQIPLSHGQKMLLPSVEGTILQEMKLTKEDKLLVCGSGTGYLSVCATKLASHVTGIDIHEDFILKSFENSKTHKPKNLSLKHLDINNNWDIISDYNRIIMTFSVNSSKMILDHMSEDSRAFIFTGDEYSPIKSGKIISKTENNGYTRDHIIQTNINHIIKGLNGDD